MKVSSIEEMRRLDKAAVENYGIVEELLMENAGEAAYFVILKEFGVRGKRFVVICGIGNNGGDGMVVARKIHSTGGAVTIFLLGDPKKFQGAARKNYEIASRLRLDIKQVESLGPLESEIARCDGIVDALFGTGLTRDVEGLYRDVIQLINGCEKMVFSLDIPSGINGNTGKIMGIAVESDYTVTFGLPKIGNMLYPGFANGGKLFVTHISFPLSLTNQHNLMISINQPVMLPVRDRNGHKGSFGDILFVAGAANYFGAPYFSALSFLRAGGGYARLASPASITPFIANKGSEIVFAPQVETETGSLALESKKKILEISELVDMVVMGPGLSLNKETVGLVKDLAREIKKPLLIDGDGITALAEDLEIVKQREHPTILTPHLGEMSRLSDLPIKKIDEDKITVLQKEAKRLKAIIVLKGAHTLIGLPDGKVFINLSGNSGMATAGSGDVLTGTIAAMFGLGIPIEDAARTGVFIHGMSGDLAAEEKGEDGITAQDILECLPHAVRRYRENFSKVCSNYYQQVFVV